MEKGFQKEPWILRKVVLPQNTDHAGVMWHGSYLNWLEEARVEALSSVGMEYSFLSKEGFEMPVVGLNIKYSTSLFHGEKVLLKSWFSKGKGPRLHWETKFFKNSFRPAAIAHVDLVLIQKDDKGTLLLKKAPEDIQEAINKLQLGPI